MGGAESRPGVPVSGPGLVVRTEPGPGPGGGTGLGLPVWGAGAGALGRAGRATRQAGRGAGAGPQIGICGPHSITILYHYYFVIWSTLTGRG